MSDDNLKTDRAQLRFAEAVVSAFSFLSEDYGFHLVKADPTFVRYESPAAFINLYHGRASYELGFEIGQLPVVPEQDERPFHLDVIIALAGAQQEAVHTSFQASTAEAVRNSAPKLATVVKKYAAPALRAEPHIFERLGDMQAQLSDKLLREWQLSDLRKEAEQAWKEKNFALFIKLYEPFEQEITSLEAKKLDYARKQLK